MPLTCAIDSQGWLPKSFGNTIAVGKRAWNPLIRPKVARVTTKRQKIAVGCICSAVGMPASPLDSGNTQTQPSIPPDQPPEQAVQDVRLSTYHYVTFFVIMAGGLLFVAALLYFNGDMAYQIAVRKSFNRLTKTIALKQLSSILAAMAFVKYGLEPVIRTVRTVTKAHGPWEKSSEYYILREVRFHPGSPPISHSLQPSLNLTQPSILTANATIPILQVYKPLEFLFLIAAVTTLAENFLPQLINLPKSLVQTVVRTTLSLTFVVAAARVVFNIKGRIVRENTWQFELKGDITRQRRLEAFDKLLSLATLVVASVFGVKALGMDVNSVLAIGGVGGVAVGLAGREILENLFTGLIILSSNPFEVGEEVLFRPSSSQVVEGIVVDVGWYRTTIRSFEREIFIIPNSVFSRNVVLNITRKNREWRFYEFLSLRLDDLNKVNAVVSDIRKILRQDGRIIQKLHRRVFLDKITRDDCTIYISFYVEATNRDAFMAIKQDLLLGFIDCVERNGASLARNKLQLEMLPALPLSPVSTMPIVDVPALPQPVDISATQEQPSNGGGGGGNGGGSGGNGGGNSSKEGSSSQAAPTTPGVATTVNQAASGSTSTVAAGAASNIVAASSSTQKIPTTVTPPAPGAANKQTTPLPSPTTTTASMAPGAAVGASPQAIISAISNSPGAASKITQVISPDSVVGGTQDGSIIMGSFDELL